MCWSVSSSPSRTRPRFGGDADGLERPIRSGDDGNGDEDVFPATTCGPSSSARPAGGAAASRDRGRDLERELERNGNICRSKLLLPPFVEVEATAGPVLASAPSASE